MSFDKIASQSNGRGNGKESLTSVSSSTTSSNVNVFKAKNPFQANNKPTFVGSHPLSGFDEPLFSGNVIENMKVCWKSFTNPLKPLPDFRTLK